MNDDVKKWMLIAVIVAFMGWNAYQAFKLRPGAKAPDQRPNAVMCAECGWTGFRETLRLPQRCPKCHKMTVHFAGICPECGAWTPWELWREELLYEHPRLFMDYGADYFFPKCHKCGAQTNENGKRVELSPIPTGGDRPQRKGASAQ